MARLTFWLDTVKGVSSSRRGGFSADKKRESLYVHVISTVSNVVSTHREILFFWKFRFERENKKQAKSVQPKCVGMIAYETTRRKIECILVSFLFQDFHSVRNLENCLCQTLKTDGDVLRSCSDSTMWHFVTTVITLQMRNYSVSIEKTVRRNFVNEN